MRLLAWAALGAPAAEIQIDATVHDDLRTVSGTMTWTGDAPLIDSLALLPEPTSDRLRLRTWPGRPSRGEVTFTSVAPGVVSFHTTLPRRYGAIGSTRHGVFASGGWYPQLEGLPLATWSVSVALPPGATGALGNVTGTETLRWEGHAESAPVSVVRRGRITRLRAGAADIALLTRGRPRGTFARELLDQADRLSVPLAGVAVEAPLRQRLVEPAPGLLYVSDRAFRETTGLAFVHRNAVARGLAEALLPIADPRERAAAADALGDRHASEVAADRARRIVGTFRWIPRVDVLLASERTAFFAEIFGSGAPVPSAAIGRPFRVTVAGWISSVDLSVGRLYFGVQGTLRREGDTHNLGVLTVANSVADLAAIEIGFVRKEGPLVDAFHRPHRLRADAGVSLLDSAYAEADRPIALDGGLSYTWDDRELMHFPLHGKRLGVGFGGGGIPESPTTWISTSAHALGIVAVHPRVALAGRSTLAVARSDLPHRLLTLGGDGAMRSIPNLPACPAFDADGTPLPCTEVATDRAHAAVEVRCAVIRGWSVPLWLAWGSELQVAVGVEGLAARVDGGPAWATGLTAGVTGTGDVLGIEEMSVGLVAGWLLDSHGLASVEPSAVPQLYLRFGQAF